MALNLKNDLFEQNDVRETVTNTPSTSPAFNLDLTSYIQQIDVSADVTSVVGMYINGAGLKLYIINDLAPSRVYECDMSVPWDITSSVYLQEFDISAKETQGKGLYFSPDGTKMFTIGTGADKVNRWSLSTPWDVSTSTWVSELSVSAKELNPQDIYFRSDGMRFYTVGITGDSIDEYYLLTPWDITGAVYLQELDISAKETNPGGINFSPDGTKLFMSGFTNDSLHRYDLTVPWNISTAVFEQTFAVRPALNLYSFYFSPNGFNLYTGSSNGFIYQFKLEVWR